MPRYSYTSNDIEKAVAGSRSIRQVLKKIGLRPAGGNYLTIKNKIKELGIDNSHFLGQGWCKNPPRNEFSLEEILIENSSYYRTDALKKKLIRSQIKKHQCEKCLRTKWGNIPIPLELNHKDGRRSNNKIENLEIICPNCHALT